MTLSRSARGAAFATLTTFAFGLNSGVSLAQGAPAARAVEPLPAVTMPDFSALVERYGPAVVNVEVVERPQTAAGRGAGPDADDPLNDFFRRFGIPNQGGGGGQQRNAPPAHGTGSGFIVSPDGYILTNAHVVSSAQTVTVRLTDRREYQAKVIGQDERTDVAVIKIEAQNLPVVKIGDPRLLKPGQWVVAIGSPFNFDNTATAGIVSATARELSGEGNNFVPFIQTDVAVNPGNSGGPLFNTRGEVVGINSQIFSQTGSYMGLSFAIPIDIAVSVENQLIKTGHVVRGRIGVQIQDVDAAFADAFGLGRPRGALVVSVEAGGPAEKAGIKPGDVILGVNGQSVEHYGDASLAISNLHPGAEARVSVWRDRKAQDISVKIALINEDQDSATAKPTKGPASGQAERLGLTVHALTVEEKQQAQTAGTLIVDAVAGPAAAANIQPGDIILGVNGKPVHSTADLMAAAKIAGKTIALLIQRQDHQIFVPLRLN
jgi:serine protease Do